MSEAAVAENPEVQIPAEPEVSTTAQQVPPESPPVTSETPDAPAPETPSPEAPTERTPDSYDLGELNGLYDQGKLSTPELVARHKELNRAEQNRQVAEQTRRTQLQQAEQQRLQQLQSAKDNLLTEMAANRQAEFDRATARGEAPDMGLIEERNRSSIERYHGQTGDIHLEPVRIALREMLVHESRIWPDTAHNRAAFAQMDLGDLVNSLYQRAFQKGQEDGKKTGPAADELKKAVAEARKAAQDELKAANPEMITGTGSGSRNGSGSKLYSQMTTEEREALSPADRDRLVAEQYSRSN